MKLNKKPIYHFERQYLIDDIVILIKLIPVFRERKNKILIKIRGSFKWVKKEDLSVIRY